ncbi:hypothetical protein [Sphingomonas sp. LY160]|uniref:hypothetical protein n=1 Tax=Sphingomonas sp. LY160 TaxID=3095342 RepID=UPI002ADEFB41|nr:hypothetical protein [Sphingomonas sp. LY160]MEA1072544.1 hypothetical protein [Sphingomonas sp. LY160]
MKSGRLVLFAAIAALGACGSVSDLEPRAGTSLPQKPALASRVLTADDLLTPPPYARPERVDELGKSGQPRTPDRFDLPPPDGADALPADSEPKADTTGPDNVGEPRR